MCSEFTAYCSHLSSDWLGVLKALCCSSVRFGYTELLSVLDVSSLIVGSVNPGCVRIGRRTLGFWPLLTAIINHLLLSIVIEAKIYFALNPYIATKNYWL